MVDAVTASQAGGRLNAGSQMLASNFETFLQLLTAQLRNQDPLSPLDSNDFTAQLTQMAGVEQQLLTNDLLTALLQQGGGSALTNASNYIGRDVTAAFSAVKLTDGEATWSYELAASANEVRVEVLNSLGQVIWSGEADATTEGVHDFTWDGQTTAGGTAQDGGVYSLRVTAVNGSGQPVDSQVLIRGRVRAVELYDGQPYLTVGSSILPLNSVLALEEAANAADSDPETQGLMSSIASALNPFN